MLCLSRSGWFCPHQPPRPSLPTTLFHPAPNYGVKSPIDASGFKVTDEHYENDDEDADEGDKYDAHDVDDDDVADGGQELVRSGDG